MRGADQGQAKLARGWQRGVAGRDDLVGMDEMERVLSMRAANRSLHAGPAQWALQAGERRPRRMRDNNVADSNTVQHAFGRHLALPTKPEWRPPGDRSDDLDVDP
jgi:hypothetical protein